MIRRSSSVRAVAVAAALLSATLLSGCQTDGMMASDRHLRPLSPQILAKMTEKDMPKESAILVRIFKQESELEVWKQDSSGRYALLKTYPICRWSGELGPKIREGDRQAPEGFYTITPGQMNPNSSFHLAFNLGYPNAFDKAHGRTGAHLMVHGDCSSRGCYAMTDDQISEIYALGRESFMGGQRSFQVQAYPFRMTPANFAKHRNNPHIAFWKMLKEGNDHFEVTRQEPKVDVCERRYVFNAQNGNFQPTGACPKLDVPAEVMAEVLLKNRQDEVQLASLLKQGGPVAPVKTGADGGMHPTFLAKLKNERDGTLALASGDGGPSSLGRHVVPPKNAFVEKEAVAEAKPAADDKKAADNKVADRKADDKKMDDKKADDRKPGARVADAKSDKDGNMFTRLFSDEDRKPTGSAGKNDSTIGKLKSSVTSLFSSDDKDAEPTREIRREAPRRPANVAVAKPEAKPEPKAEPRSAAGGNPGQISAARDGKKDVVTSSVEKKDRAKADQPLRTDTGAAQAASLLRGAQPALAADSFESRWSGAR